MIFQPNGDDKGVAFITTSLASVALAAPAG
jgi:hypothetical protein